METWILVTAIVVPLLVTIFGDDLRKLRRVLTTTFNFVRRKWRRLRRWYTHCSERDLVAKFVSNPEEAAPVFFKSLIGSEQKEYWGSQLSPEDNFRLDVIWKYRGFWASLGSRPYKDDDDLTWAVAFPSVFLSVTGLRPGHQGLHWTGSATIDVATAYIDDQIEESGVANYKPPLRFRAARRLLEFLQKLKVQRR